MTDYMVTGLVAKRAELAGEITATHERLRELVRQLEHIDGTLRIVAPDMEVEAIRPKAFRPPDDWSKRGQMSRLVLSILRQSKEPLTSREIAAAGGHNLLMCGPPGAGKSLLAACLPGILPELNPAEALGIM